MMEHTIRKLVTSAADACWPSQEKASHHEHFIMNSSRQSAEAVHVAMMEAY
jgi:hypothetical protein